MVHCVILTGRMIVQKVTAVQVKLKVSLAVVKFNPNHYKKILPHENEYYLVDYVTKAYVGRVLKVGKKHCTLKSLEDRSPNTFDWPKRDDVDDVNVKTLFCGLIKLKGTVPFKVQGIHDAFTSFKA